MIKEVDNLTIELKEFIEKIKNDLNFSDPMLKGKEEIEINLVKAIGKKDYLVLEIVDENTIGLFSFLVIEEEKYIEMLVGLSKEKNAYLEIFNFLKISYKGYDIDFVFNPNNYLLKGLLEENNALFEIEQQKMIHNGKNINTNTSKIELLKDEYIETYIKIHNKDMYWTADKVVLARDRFRVFVAILNEEVIGYIDVTYNFKENEVFDFFVKEEYRNQGYGKKLLKKALEMNKPNKMIVLVNVDNTVAINLYKSLGFEKLENSNSLVAHLKL